jgi:hypothetical protein
MPKFSNDTFDFFITFITNTMYKDDGSNTWMNLYGKWGTTLIYVDFDILGGLHYLISQCLLLFLLLT